MDSYKKYMVNKLAERNHISQNIIDTSVDIFEKGYIDSIGIFLLLAEIEVDLEIDLSFEDISALPIYSIDCISSVMEKKCQ